ncbi:MAG: hypothetical protein ACLTE4_02430 [Christensenellaceae bacterium]
MKRWSNLQKQLYLILDNKINLQIHCSVYRMNSQRGSTNLPRYWITLNREIIFDYPKISVSKEDYPYTTEISDISELLREYLDSPKEQILAKNFGNDKYGITNLLKAADTRISINKLEQYFQNNIVKNADICKTILKARGQN